MSQSWRWMGTTRTHGHLSMSCPFVANYCCEMIREGKAVYTCLPRTGKVAMSEALSRPSSLTLCAVAAAVWKL